MTMNSQQLPPELYSRYGIKPGRKRSWIIPAALVFVMAGLLLSLGNRLIGQGNLALIEWQELSPNQVEIIWNINRPDNSAVWCVARVQDEERFDVAFATFWLSATEGTTTYRTVLSTLGNNFAVPAPTCSSDGWDALAPAHFRPGLLPPAQAAPLAASWQAASSALNE